MVKVSNRINISLFVYIIFSSAFLSCNPSYVKNEKEISKSRSQDKILVIVTRETQRMKSIYENELKRNPRIIGTIKIGFTIQPSGYLKDVTVEECSLNDTEFKNVILTYVSGWRFPPTNDTANIRVVYPFAFEQAK